MWSFDEMTEQELNYNRLIPNWIFYSINAITKKNVLQEFNLELKMFPLVAIV